MTVDDHDYEVRVSRSGETITFPKTSDLAAALEQLHELNRLQMPDGTPIYARWMTGPYSTWAFHQQTLFLQYLVELVRYRPLLGYLLEQRRPVHGVRTRSWFLQWMLQRLELTSGVPAPSRRDAITRTVARGLTEASRVVHRLKREPVLVYTPDFVSRGRFDFRFFDVYEWLRANGIAYREVFHTTLGRRFFRNAARRRRFATYREAYPPGASPAAGVELAAACAHLDRPLQIIVAEVAAMAADSVGRTEALHRHLQGSHFRLLISLDDVRYANELVVACRRLGIRSVGIQHGQFTKYHVGWHNYGIPAHYSVTYDPLYVWNDYWKRALQLYSSQYQSNVRVGGSLRPLPRLNLSPRRRVASMADLNVLVPYEALGPKDGLARAIAFLRGQGARIHFKLRPDHDPERQLQPYGLSPGDVVLVKSLGEPALNAIDVVLGLYSTFLHEMLFYGLPVLMIESPFDKGHQMVDDGLVLLVNPDAMPAGRILTYINTPRSYRVDPWPPEPTTLIETLEHEYRSAMAS